MPTPTCRISEHPTRLVGTKTGKFSGEPFQINQCRSCGFANVMNPPNMSEIYDEAYYQGNGADPLVDYAFEYANPSKTIRTYEWKGIIQLANGLFPNPITWLDYGCGTGGLVREARSCTRHQLHGCDSGAWVQRAKTDKLPVSTLDEINKGGNGFDFVTAIEVLEHIPDPIETLHDIRKLLKPGGLLFLTTGNVSKAPKHLIDWSYLIPEIHVSFFTPRSLEVALQKTGFDPFYHKDSKAWTSIIRFKILKNLGIKQTGWMERLLPWPLLTQLADVRYGVSNHPMGVAV